MPRSASEWEAKPKFPDTHYVDTRIYTDEGLFREEQQKIFDKCWIIAWHESEVPNPFDYRVFRHPGGEDVIVIRGDDGTVRAFFNVCPHRGNTLLYDPVGNAKRITCIFHAWSFDSKGDCIDISRANEGYQDRLCKADVGLRNVRCEIGFGGFVWVNIDDQAVTLKEYIGDALDMLGPYMEQPMEVFHYHKAVVNTN